MNQLLLFLASCILAEIHIYITLVYDDSFIAPKTEIVRYKKVGTDMQQKCQICWCLMIFKRKTTLHFRHFFREFVCKLVFSGLEQLVLKSSLFSWCNIQEEEEAANWTSSTGTYSVLLLHCTYYLMLLFLFAIYMLLLLLLLLYLLAFACWMRGRSSPPICPRLGAACCNNSPHFTYRQFLMWFWLEIVLYQVPHSL